MPCLMILRSVRVNTRSMHDSLIKPICVLPFIFCCRSNAAVISHNFSLAGDFFIQSMLTSPVSALESFAPMTVNKQLSQFLFRVFTVCVTSPIA